MNIVIWIVAGGVVGWAAYAVLKANEQRGVIVSMIMGMVAGLVGGKELAPLFSAAAGNANDFSPFALFIALATAAACLTIGNMIHNRFGV